MARTTNEAAAPVYEVAERFVEVCLRSNGSLFTPGEPIWTEENAADLQNRLTDNPDDSSDSFLKKFERQLASADPGVVQFAGELFYFHLLVAANIGGDTKRSQVNSVLGWSSSPVGIPSDFATALDHGVASVGVAFNTFRPNQLSYLLEFLANWKALTDTSRHDALDNPWVFKQRAGDPSQFSAYMQYNALLHLVHPQAFEDIVARDWKDRITEGFSDLTEEGVEDVDRQLLAIREVLEEESGRSVTFWESPLRERWDPEWSGSDSSYWLFQANPKVWDLEADLSDRSIGDEGDWSVTRFGNEMQVGDGVILWSAGDRAGVYALGALSSGVFERPHEGFADSAPSQSGTESAIRFRHTAIFDEPLLKIQLNEHPILRGLSVIKAPQGSNFRVTSEQWKAVEELLDAGSNPRTWWVYQGQTFQEALGLGMIWAPTVTRSGQKVVHHTNVGRVQPGDVVLSYANGAIRAIGLAESDPTVGARPADTYGDEDGREYLRVGVKYFELRDPIKLTEIALEIRGSDAGPFTATGGPKQGYLFDVAPTTAVQVRRGFASHWPAGSPWDDPEARAAAAVHLVFKWRLDTEPHTVELHKEVADAQGSVWWGKFGEGKRAAMRREFVDEINGQVADGTPTYAFLHRAGELWRTELINLTSDPDEVDQDRLPGYYGVDQCELFAQIRQFEQLEPIWALERLVLAADPDPTKTAGALGNQRTPLRVMIRRSAKSFPFPQSEEFDLDWLEQETLWPRDRLEELVSAANTTRQVVLAGPPGTSKTWVAKALAKHLTNGTEGGVRIVQFHPSYSYEEFIEGLRPEVDDEGILTFEVRDGVIKTMAGGVPDDAEQAHVLVIDEMNRANLPRVFGELMFLFEYRDEPIDLQYTRDFVLPSNLLFVGAMNTADRSVRSIDIALRRRFDFFECPPDAGILTRFYEQDEHTNDVGTLVVGMIALNDRLEGLIDKHHTIGHTFFMSEHMTVGLLRSIWERKIGPLIEEYFFDQPDRVAEFKLDELWELGD